MIVSKSKKFIYLKTRKCGGTSIQNTLLPYCNREDIVSKGFYLNAITNYQCPLEEFATLDEVVKHININPNEYFKFGFARNPFSITLSRYFYQIKMGRVKEIPSRGNFNKWAKAHYFVTNEQFNYLGDGTKHMFFDKEGKEIVDFIGKLENVEEDFEYVKEKLNLDKSLKVKKDNVANNNKVHYRDWMNDETIALVNNYFEFELKYYNYEY